MTVRTWVVSSLAVLWALGLVHQASAVDLSRRDRLLIYYYNYYLNEQNSRKLLANQNQFQRDFIQFRDAQNQRLNQPDPIDLYVRQGRASAPQGMRVPAIYSRGGQQRQYFMRFNYFNPPRSY